ncbi:aminotransferase class I and II [Stenotrophomonas sp. ATCM1_4]|uniref:HipA family kinase n=1 Tax=Stenotrophomonas capsici TaxID=3110230 RepID=A0ABU5V7D4_9GAMM|nr:MULTISPECIES: HipA family kinase [unclassified Stenotrophomonas]MEA5669264.1 HipA family kinase [Stenotrophomonas sp. MH1]TDB27823.1 aminotransferase class I and II [Stenotrophomonas sp. ATCM1_4]
MRTVHATRYITPLREGGSLPAVIEADDDGMYVIKFRGAGQGPKALIAELVAGELARALGLPIPEIVLVELDREFARTEPDPEIQDLIRASEGTNLGSDYLPGAINYDPAAMQPDAELASRIVWFDAYTSNVDRTVRNPNLMVWHRKLYLIDHGAALYFHHDWENAGEACAKPFVLIRDHVLLPFAKDIAGADRALAPLLTDAVIDDIVALIPDAWLQGEPAFADAASYRKAYADYLKRRLQLRDAFVQEAIRAHAAHV